MKILKIISVVAICLAISMAAFELWPRTSKGGLNQHIPALRAALNKYHEKNSKWPASIGDLKNDGLLPDGWASEFDEVKLIRVDAFQQEKYVRYRLLGIKAGPFRISQTIAREILLSQE